jgi:hypothetical protein
VVQIHHTLPSAIWEHGDFKSNLEINVLECGKLAFKGSPGTQNVSDKVCSRPKLQIKYLRMSSKRKKKAKYLAKTQLNHETVHQAAKSERILLGTIY